MPYNFIKYRNVVHFIVNIQKNKEKTKNVMISEEILEKKNKTKTSKLPAQGIFKGGAKNKQ